MLVAILELQVFDTGQCVLFGGGSVGEFITVACCLEAPVPKLAVRVIGSVVAAAAVKHVVAGATGQVVVALGAAQCVVAAAANQHIAAGVARNAVIASQCIVITAIGRCKGIGIVASRSPDSVFTAAAADGVR